MYGSWKSIIPTIGGEVMILPIVYPIVLCTENDTSPNHAGVAHVHRLYVADARKSKLEVSPDAAQTNARRALDDATQQSRNI